MRPSDDSWVGLAELDRWLADGVWAGTLPPDEAPPWSEELRTLVLAARGPAMPDELAAERAIVAGMSDVLRAGRRAALRRDRWRSGGGWGALGGVAAVKTAVTLAAATVGAATLAASTGFVVSLVMPGPGDPPPSPAPATTERPEDRPGDRTAGQGAGTPGGDDGGADGCPARAVDADCGSPDDPSRAATGGREPTSPAGHGPRDSGESDGSGDGTSPGGQAQDGQSGSASAQSEGGSLADEAASEASQDGSAPGRSGSAPGRAGTTPGQGGSASG